MYQVMASGLILRLTDGAIIPTDPGNRDYTDYLAWVDAGNAATQTLNLDETDNTWS
jgi:hypothetical protein